MKFQQRSLLPLALWIPVSIATRPVSLQLSDFQHQSSLRAGFAPNLGNISWGDGIIKGNGRYSQSPRFLLSESQPIYQAISLDCSPYGGTDLSAPGIYTEALREAGSRYICACPSATALTSLLIATSGTGDSCIAAIPALEPSSNADTQEDARPGLDLKGKGVDHSEDGISRARPNASKDSEEDECPADGAEDQPVCRE